jgi:2-amino-4-hydroxy-6-hydroxymethyldihydropteridine diphosphokinase
LAPLELLDAVKRIERDLGRVETIRWGPRVIDIDILFYGEEALSDPRLVLPHRELLRRAFVLVPLAEIAPDRAIAGVRVADAAQALGDEGVRKWQAA